MHITFLNEMSGLFACAENTEEAYAVVGQSVNKLVRRCQGRRCVIYKPLSNALELTASWGEGHLGEPVLRVTTAGLCAWATGIGASLPTGDCL